MNRTEIGRQGEEAAVKYLRQNGLEIVERNFRIRGGEIDIVAKDGPTLCLIEVKTRRSVRYGDPREAVSFFKKNRLVKAGLAYVSFHDLSDVNIRFDVLIVLPCHGVDKRIDWVKNAFEV